MNDDPQPKKSWVTIVAAALIIGGLLLILNNVRPLYPWWRLRFGIYPYAGDKKALAQGKKLYQERCEGCHGIRGELTKHQHPIKQHVKMHNPDNYYQIITDGLPKNGMPGFRNNLSANERWKIVSYIFNQFESASKNDSKKSD